MGFILAGRGLRERFRSGFVLDRGFRWTLGFCFWVPRKWAIQV